MMDTGFKEKSPKNWDKYFPDTELPIAFYHSNDVLSGLFAPASFDESLPYGVIAPFCAGCASIVDYPYFRPLNPVPS